MSGARRWPRASWATYDAAVMRRSSAWTRRLDDIRLTPRNIWLSLNERRAAARTIPKDLRAALEHAARNIRRVAEAQLPRSWSIAVEPGVRVSQRVSAIDTIGCYIPGGRFSLVSTLLMTAIPAQVAGVRRIVVACPRPNAALLAAAEMLGLEEIAHIGGAQAIAAFAYGTRIGTARGQNLWAGKSIRYRGQASRERRLRNRPSRRPDRSIDRRAQAEIPAILPRISWPRPSTILTPSRFSLRRHANSRRPCAMR